MADRAVVIRLRAVTDDFQRQMLLATKATEDLAKQTEKTGGLAATSLGRMVQSAQNNSQAWTTVGTTFAAVGAAAATGFALAVKSYADFDKSISGIKAATGETAANMELLRAAAMRAGADTKYSATEAADAITEMAKAGVSTKDILGGGLNGALALAAAGQMDVAEAAETAASAMTQFGLKGADIPHIADLLAAGAGKAQGSVSDMGEALNQAGLVAAQTGLSIEETTGALAAFASNGLIGSDAGTSFKTMLQSLTPNSEAAAKAMEDMGFSAYDSQGNFKGLTTVAGDLQRGLSTMSVEQQNATLKTIFGSDAVRAASIIFKEGAGGVQEWIDQVNDSGYAAEQAAAQMDNLTGDLETLKGGLETALIGTGEAADGPLRDLVQTLTGVVDGYNNLSDSAQGAVLVTGGIVAALGLAAGAFITLAPKVLDTVTSFRQLKADMPEVADGLGKTAKAAGIAGAALAVLAVASQTLPSVTDNVMSSAQAAKLLSDQATGIKELDAQVRALGGSSWLADADGFDSLQEGLSNLADPRLSDRLTDVAYSALAIVNTDYEKGRPERAALVEQLGSLGDGLAALVNSGQADKAAQKFDVMSQAAKAAGMTQEELLELMPAYRDALADQAAQGDLAARSADGLAAATGQAASSLGAIPGAAAGTFDSLGAYAQALGLSEDATKELATSTSEMGRTLSDFVDPVGAYKSLLDEKIAKEKEARGITEETNGAAKDSWDAFVGSAKVSMSKYIEDLQRQVDAQTNWQENMLRLAGRVSQGTIDQLARLGPEGAPLVAQLVDASDDELDRYVTLTASKSKAATDAWGEQLRLAQPVLAQIAKTAGQGVADSLARELAAGTTTVAQIASDYGISLANGVNPVLTSLGKSAIAVSRANLGASNGRSYTGYADGGFEDHTAQIAPAGAWRVWAEEETGGEAYIPLSPAKRTRSTEIWRETGRRLGQDVSLFADGGFTTASSVPGLPSVNPFRDLIGTPAIEAMSSARDAVTSFMDEIGTLFGGGFARSGKATPNGIGGLGPMAAAARRFVMGQFGLTNIGGYANRNIAGTGTKSDHATGHAIDVMIPNYKSPGSIALGNQVASYFVGNPGAYGTKYVIWRDQINSGGGWKPYRHPGGGGGDTLQHRDHVHVSFFNDGGLTYSSAAAGMKGSAGNPHVRDSGGPLLPGFTFNGTGRPETVLPVAPQDVRVVDAAALAGTVAARGGGDVNLTINAPSTTEDRHAREIAQRLSDAVYGNGLNGLVI